jgi:dTDP-4-amino-4,6-dideoxygalactose transaminase
MAGAHPLIIDVDPETWIVSPAVLEQALQETKAQAAMIVSPFGLRQSFAEHIRVCREHDALLVIDNAAGLGVRREIEEQPPDMLEVCSMHATKPFAVGEGGVIFANTACEESLHGALNFALTTCARPEGPRWGINGKMPEIGAAIGLAQLETFDSQLKARRHFAKAYVEVLGRFTDLSYVRDAGRSPWQFFPVLLPSSDLATRFIDDAANLGLEIRRYYRPSLSIWPGVELAHACPIAENLSERMCCLPVYSDASPVERADMAGIVERSLQATLS